MIEQVYSIKDLAGFSGVKAHTIRMWEQRYNLLNPKRTETNIRRYSEEDLKKLLNVSLLLDKGYKISHVAHMSEDEISEALLDAANSRGTEQEVLNTLKLCTLNFDENQFYRATEQYLAQHSMRELFERIYIPFLHQVGLMWQASSICPAHEHFVSNLIRQQVSGALDRLRQAPSTQRTFVLYLPAGEMHELSLLMLHYLLRVQGHQSIYLGQSVPSDDLIQLLPKVENADFVTILTAHSSTTNKSKFMDKLAEAFADRGCRFHLAGRDLEGFEDRGEPWMNIYSDTGTMAQALLD